MIALNFITALVLTEVIEISVAFLLGYRGKKFYAVLILINIITNPLLNCILMILYYFNINSIIITPVLEVLVIIAEWRFFKYVLGRNEKSYLFLSVLINLSSYIIGLIII